MGTLILLAAIAACITIITSSTGSQDRRRPAFTVSWEAPVTIRHSTSCFIAMGNLVSIRSTGEIILGVAQVGCTVSSLLSCRCHCCNC